MYWFEQVEYKAMVDHANEELALGRRYKTGEREALPSTLEEQLKQLQSRPATLADKDKEEDDEGLYTGHHERLCERADDQGLLHACNDTWLEVRTWNNDIRGVLTMMGWGSLGMLLWFGGGNFVDLLYTYSTGHLLSGAVLTPEELRGFTVASIFTSFITVAAIWALHRYFLRYELLTQRWIRLRFNRKTQKVYLLRPKYAGGLMEFDWTATQPMLPGEGSSTDQVWLTWPVLMWFGQHLGQPTVMQFIGRRTGFKTAGDWMAFWEYIRRYMEEGPAAVPTPKTVIGYWPSPKEAWLSVTQWFPAFQQKGLAGKFSDGVTVLILPVIAWLLVGNFLAQCLTWQARFPKDIEHAGEDA